VNTPLLTPTTQNRLTTRLTELVTAAAARPDLWRPLVRFSERDRCWSRLEGPGDVDLWLLTWTRSQSTDLHDHGRSTAALTVVQGTVTEVRPDGHGGLRADTLGVGGLRTVDPGHIHDIRNDGDEPAVSIHGYSPRLEQMTFYRVVDGTPVVDRTVRTDQPEL
jgi:mannose-6-phosphate isomerase-like protein (cupin superfamily)